MCIRDSCWAVLYLLTPVWTWYLLQTPVSYLTGAVNSVLPMLLGAFTAWFQRWYRRITPQAKNNDTHAVPPVSYTHLDVYKRQVHIRMPPKGNAQRTLRQKN